MTELTLGWRQTARHIVTEPFRAAFEHGNQALVTSASAYMAAMFSMQHGVLPVWIAVPLAVGFEWTYLRGLSTSDKTRANGWANALNWTAMLTSAVYGILFILGYYNVIPARPEPGAAFWLAVAHVGPMTLLSFCYAGVRRSHKQEQLTAVAHTRAQDAIRLARLQEQQDQLAFDAALRKAQLQDDYQRQQMEMQRIAHEQKLALELAEMQRNQRAISRQLVDTNLSTNQGATKRSPLDGVDVAAEILRLGSAAAVSREYGVTRQAVDKRLRAK